MTSTVNTPQNAARRLLRAAGPALVAFVLYACSGGDDAPAARATPDPMPEPMPGPGPGPNPEPMPDPIPDPRTGPVTFSSSSSIATTVAGQINLDELTDHTAGAGVAVAAVVRNLPDLSAGELLPKAAAGNIQLRDAAGAPVALTTANAYLTTHDLGRFGDGSFIAHILAGQSANPGSDADPDIPGISQGVDDLDIYALNYLASPTPRSGESPEYAAPADFLTRQAMATDVLNYVTGPTVAGGTDSRRQIVLFSNPVTPVELIPGLSCESAANELVALGETGAVRQARRDTCIMRGVQANLGTNHAPYTGAVLTNTAQTDWFYDHAVALSKAGKVNKDDYPTIVVPAGDVYESSLNVFHNLADADEPDTAGGYLAPAANLADAAATAVQTGVEQAVVRAQFNSAGVGVALGPTNSYARLPGLTDTITRDDGTTTLEADFPISWW